MPDQQVSEEWRPVVGWENAYRVSNLGRVYGSKGIKSTFDCHGYRKIAVCRNGKSKSLLVHRVVAEAFIGPPGGLQVNHKNSVRWDNRAENLEYVTHRQNLQLAGVSRLTREQVLEMRALHAAGGVTYAELGRRYGVWHQTARGVIVRDTWKDV